MTTTCSTCGADTGRRWARYCDTHRFDAQRKPPIYVLTPERRAYLQQRYRPNERGVSFRLARILRVPKWRITRWAAELGLTGTCDKGTPWTPQEDAVLEAFIGRRHVGFIAKRLKRTVSSVVGRIKRRELSRRGARTWYTASEVALGFGVDPGTVVRWIDAKKLAARHEGQDLASGRPAAWRVEPAACRQFAREHPTVYSLAKVDQVWFLDLVFAGAIGARSHAA